MDGLQAPALSIELHIKILTKLKIFWRKDFGAPEFLVKVLPNATIDLLVHKLLTEWARIYGYISQSQINELSYAAIQIFQDTKINTNKGKAISQRQLIFLVSTHKFAPFF